MKPFPATLFGERGFSQHSFEQTKDKMVVNLICIHLPPKWSVIMARRVGSTIQALCGTGYFALPPLIPTMIGL